MNIRKLLNLYMMLAMILGALWLPWPPWLRNRQPRPLRPPCRRRISRSPKMSWAPSTRPTTTLRHCGLGPDGFGYMGFTWTYNWVDIVASDGRLALGDDASAVRSPSALASPSTATCGPTFTRQQRLYAFGAAPRPGHRVPAARRLTPNNLIALSGTTWTPLTPATPSTTRPSPPAPWQRPVSRGPVENFTTIGRRHLAGTCEAMLYADGKVLIQFEDAGAERVGLDHRHRGQRLCRRPRPDRRLRRGGLAQRRNVLALRAGPDPEPGCLLQAGAWLLVARATRWTIPSSSRTAAR